MRTPREPRDTFIYVLERRNVNTDRRVDVADGFVIVARSNKYARQMASADCGDEGPGVWLDKKYSTCRPIGVPYEERTKKRERIVLRDYHAG